MMYTLKEMRPLGAVSCVCFAVKKKKKHKNDFNTEKSLITAHSKHT